MSAEETINVRRLVLMLKRYAADDILFKTVGSIEDGVAVEQAVADAARSVLEEFDLPYEIVHDSSGAARIIVTLGSSVVTMNLTYEVGG